MSFRSKYEARRKGMRRSLLSDVAGNTLAIAAAAVVPLTGLLGGGLDMSRMYLVRTRLQAACDAGSLAGRRTMGGGAWSANGGAANTAATKMFELNFASDAYGTTGVTKSFSEAGGNVGGTASVVVPMTLTKVLGVQDQTVNITCNSAMRLPNTDVMFVLDNTGSMNCETDGSNCTGGPTSKIEGLKGAVKCFYETLAIQDTAADCGSAPSGGVGSQTQLRFGFVPYTVNVNVGKLLPNDYFVDDWTYQSRVAQKVPKYVITGYSGESSETAGGSSDSNFANTSGWNNQGTNVFVSPTTYVATQPGVTSSTCSGATAPPVQDSPNGTPSSPNLISQTTPTYPDTLRTNTYGTTQGVNRVSYRYRWTKTSGSGSSALGVCQLQYRNSTYDHTNTTMTTQNATWEQRMVFDKWSYQPVSFDVSGLKAGTNTWNDSIDLPIGTTAVGDENIAPATVNWDGCIEERQTFRNADGVVSDDWSPIPADALDMNIDLIPTGDATTRWAPALENAVWGRYTGSGTESYANVVTASDLSRNVQYYCPTEARKLQDWGTSPTDFEGYVDSLYASGNTYHDIGLLWGARLMSPTGLFASENAFTPLGGEIQRHMIFMTDGDTYATNQNYTAYGVHWWDRRQTVTSTPPSNAQLNDLINARFVALCTAVKNQNITLWVISFGNGSNTTTEDRLKSCASPNRYYKSGTNAQLTTDFKAIAQEISQLRLTQ
jgi:hypothetical protein